MPGSTAKGCFFSGDVRGLRGSGMTREAQTSTGMPLTMPMGVRRTSKFGVSGSPMNFRAIVGSTVASAMQRVAASVKPKQ